MGGNRVPVRQRTRIRQLHCVNTQDHDQAASTAPVQRHGAGHARRATTRASGPGKATTARANEERFTRRGPASRPRRTTKHAGGMRHQRDSDARRVGFHRNRRHRDSRRAAARRSSARSREQARRSRSSSSTPGRANPSDTPPSRGLVDGQFTRYINDTANTPNDQTGTGYDPGKYSGDQQFTNWEDAFTVEARRQPGRAGRGPGGLHHRRRPDGAEHHFRPRVRDGLVDGERPGHEAGRPERRRGQDAGLAHLRRGRRRSGYEADKRAAAHRGLGVRPVRTRRRHGAPSREADYTLVEDFADLAQALRAIATELCGAAVTVTKEVDEEGDGKYVAGERAGTSGPRSAVSGRLQVGPAAPETPRLQTTDGGNERGRRGPVPVEAQELPAISTVSITETPGAGLRVRRGGMRAGQSRLSSGNQVRRRVRITPGNTPHVSSPASTGPAPCETGRSHSYGHDHDRQGRGAEQRHVFQLHRHAPDRAVHALGRRQPARPPRGSSPASRPGRTS